MCLDFILPKLDLFLLFLLSNLIQNADYWMVICTSLSFWDEEHKVCLKEDKVKQEL